MFLDDIVSTQAKLVIVRKKRMIYLIIYLNKSFFLFFI